MYFVMTGLHALHLSIGMVGIAALAWGQRRRQNWAQGRQIEAWALYWHFVDVIWIFLYPLLYLIQRHA